MLEIEVLSEEVSLHFPKAKVTIDRPSKENGHWFLDIASEQLHVVVEWRPEEGFGVSTGSAEKPHGYGEGPDIVVPSRRDAFVEVASRLLG